MLPQDHAGSGKAISPSPSMRSGIFGMYAASIALTENPVFRDLITFVPGLIGVVLHRVPMALQTAHEEDVARYSIELARLTARRRRCKRIRWIENKKNRSV